MGGLEHDRDLAKLQCNGMVQCQSIQSVRRANRAHSLASSQELECHSKSYHGPKCHAVTLFSFLCPLYDKG